MMKLLRSIFDKKTHKKYAIVRNANYKTEDQLSKNDYLLIDADRNNTGIMHYSDEYYYNHILFYNFDEIELS